MNFDELCAEFDRISRLFDMGFANPMIIVQMRYLSRNIPRFFCEFNQMGIRLDSSVIHVIGNGSTPEEAMYNYLNLIKNEILVYREGLDDQKEVNLT